MKACPHRYKLHLNPSSPRVRGYQCCQLRGGFMLKHWVCTKRDCPLIPGTAAGQTAKEGASDGSVIPAS
jgi:hypothetical protein